MMEPTGAGELRQMVRFERRAKVQDGYGNEDGAWETLIEGRSAKLLPTRATAEVMAQRMQGVIPHDLWVISNDDVAAVTDADRVVDVDNPTRVFKIAAAGMDMSGRGRWLLFQLTLGKADG